jgi:hypothetical protein
MLDEFSKLSDFKHPEEVVLFSPNHRVLVQRLGMDIYLPIDPSIIKNERYEDMEEYQLIFPEISSKGFCQKIFDKKTRTVSTVIIPYSDLEKSKIDSFLKRYC